MFSDLSYRSVYELHNRYINDDDSWRSPEHITREEWLRFQDEFETDCTFTACMKALRARASGSDVMQFLNEVRAQFDLLDKMRVFINKYPKLENKIFNFENPGPCSRAKTASNIALTASQPDPRGDLENFRHENRLSIPKSNVEGRQRTLEQTLL